MRAISNTNNPELTKGAVRTLHNLSMHKQGLLAIFKSAPVSNLLPPLSQECACTRYSCPPPPGDLPPAPPIFHLHPDLNQPHNYENDGRSQARAQSYL